MKTTLFIFLLLIVKANSYASCFSCYSIAKVKLEVIDDSLIGYIKIYQESYDYNYNIDSSSGSENATLNIQGKESLYLYTILDSLTYNGNIWQDDSWSKKKIYYTYFTGKTMEFNVNSIKSIQILKWPIGAHYNIELEDELDHIEEYGAERDIGFIDTLSYHKIMNGDLKGIYILPPSSEYSWISIFKFDNARIPEIHSLWKILKEEPSYDNQIQSNIESLLDKIKGKYNTHILYESALD